jgi:aspartyl-tRNA(Asn)/glutamyl-tRNA(Gln) amidotransferase subunit A
MTLSQLRRKLDQKEIGAVELTNQYLERIKQYDSDIHSFITVCEEEAIKAAEHAQQRIDSGSSHPLTGIPISIKDNICTKDIKTTCASKMLADFIPFYDATAVSRLKTAGCVLLGKTNMDEFAMGGSSQTSYFGGVRNPYNLTYVPGGSSGGAAASVAAGFCPIALGSDTGGSVRQPAAFCGVTALKPTYGVVSRYGLIAFASSLDQIGMIATSAADCMYLLSCIAGQDKNDATSIALPDNFMSPKHLERITIGIPKEFFGDGISSEVKKYVLAAAKQYEAMGYRLVETTLPSLSYAVSAYYLISSAEAASNLARFDGIKYGYRSEAGSTYEEVISNTRGEGFGAEVKRRILLGNYALSSGYYDAYYKNASRIRAQIKQEYQQIFKTCDCILTPTAPTTAYKIGEQENDPVKMYLADICTVTANIAGLPAVSTPCGYSKEGLPISMSLVGRPFEEATLCKIVSQFEESFCRREVLL